MLRLSTRAKLKIATLLNRMILEGRALLGRPPSGVFRRNGLCYSLDLKEGIDFGVDLFGIYER